MIESAMMERSQCVVTLRYSSTVYTDGGSLTHGRTMEVHLVQSTVMGRSSHAVRSQKFTQYAYVHSEEHILKCGKILEVH